MKFILKLCFLLIFSFFILNCSDDDKITEEPPIEEPPILDSISYLALGDSYTIGQGVETAERWPNQLYEKLIENQFQQKELKIIAQTGWTTTNLLNAINNADLNNYNLVSLLIGVNNQFQNRPFETFKSEFNVLIDTSIYLAGNVDRVFVVSIPDYGVTPFGSNNSEEIAMELDMYNNYMQQQCDSLNIPFINITEISREMGSTDGALATDNLHPSGNQYTEWVKEILPVVLEILLE